jgi:hypothetical protein
MGTFFLKKIKDQDIESFLIAKHYLPEIIGGNWKYVWLKQNNKMIIICIF